MARVRFIDVTKRYGDGAEAISALNLDIADGEFVVLVGPSGSGKSTALRMLAGLEDISSGEIWIGDRVVNDLAPRDRVFVNVDLVQHGVGTGACGPAVLAPYRLEARPARYAFALRATALR